MTVNDFKMIKLTLYSNDRKVAINAFRITAIEEDADSTLVNYEENNNIQCKRVSESVEEVVEMMETGY